MDLYTSHQATPVAHFNWKVNDKNFWYQRIYKICVLKFGLRGWCAATQPLLPLGAPRIYMAIALRNTVFVLFHIYAEAVNTTTRNVTCWTSLLLAWHSPRSTECKYLNFLQFHNFAENEKHYLSTTLFNFVFLERLCFVPIKM